MKKKHNTRKIEVDLKADEVVWLQRLVRAGAQNARTVTRARILLLSNRDKTNREIVDALDVSPRSVTDIRTRYETRGSAEAAVMDAPRSGQPRKITAKHEAFVIATACTDAPEGHDHWTLGALKEKLLATHRKLDSVSHERIRHILMEADLKPWREKNVVRAASHA
jgi:transposase